LLIEMDLMVLWIDLQMDHCYKAFQVRQTDRCLIESITSFQFQCQEKTNHPTLRTNSD
jgi:hypothetical protein